MPSVGVSKKHSDSSIINMLLSDQTVGLDHCSSLAIEITLFYVLFSRSDGNTRKICLFSMRKQLIR